MFRYKKVVHKCRNCSIKKKYVFKIKVSLCNFNLSTCLQTLCSYLHSLSSGELNKLRFNTTNLLIECRGHIDTYANILRFFRESATITKLSPKNSTHSSKSSKVLRHNKILYFSVLSVIQRTQSRK